MSNALAGIPYPNGIHVYMWLLRRGGYRDEADIGSQQMTTLLVPSILSSTVAKIETAQDEIIFNKRSMYLGRLRGREAFQQPKPAKAIDGVRRSTTQLEKKRQEERRSIMFERGSNTCAYLRTRLTGVHALHTMLDKTLSRTSSQSCSRPTAGRNVAGYLIEGESAP
jgi:hypothetical protein